MRILSQCTYITELLELERKVFTARNLPEKISRQPLFSLRDIAGLCVARMFRDTGKLFVPPCVNTQPLAHVLILCHDSEFLDPMSYFIRFRIRVHARRIITFSEYTLHSDAFDRIDTRTADAGLWMKTTRRAAYFFRSSDSLFFRSVSLSA